MKVSAEDIQYLKEQTGKSEEEILQGLAKEGLEPQTMGGKALDVAGRIFDATGGVTRTALAQGAEALTGADLYNEGDWAKAMSGRAPSTDELLGRGGMEEGMTRSSLGFVGDVALDPAVLASGTIKAGGSLLSKLASVVGKKEAAKMIAEGAAKGASASRFLNPTEVAMQIPGLKQAGEAATSAVSKGLDKAGRFVYQSRALQALDDVADRAGKESVGDIMYREGMTGTSATLEDKIKAYNKKILAEREGILQDIGQTKVSGNEILDSYAKQSSGVLDPLSAEGRNVEKLAAYEDTKKMGKEWFEPLNERSVYDSSLVMDKKIPQGNLAQLTDIMTSVNQAVGSGAYKGGAINQASTKELKKLSAVARKEMYNAAKKADPEKAARMAQINEDISAILSTAKKMESEAGKTASSVVVGPMTGATLMSGNAGLAIGKGLGDLGKSTVFRTNTGIALKNMGKAASRKNETLTDILDSVARQTGTRALREEE